MEIGIDIGTSYSSVAVLGENGPLPVKSDTGQCAYGNSYSIPSAVFAKKDGTLLIGQAAVASRMIDPSCFRDCFKRDFGTAMAFLLGEEEYTADQFYIEFFKHFKQVSEKLTGEKVSKAYLTHPANYTEYKRQKLKSAAAYAGLLNVQLIDEPTAAALNYFDKKTVKTGEKLLIYDFGGGTFDLALIKVTEDSFESLTSPLGLEYCGGADFDMMIYNDIINTLSQEHDISAAIGSIQFRAMLSEQCIKLKHMLSYDTIASIAVPLGFSFVNYSISREKYNQMIAPQVKMTCELVVKIVNNAGIQLSDIDRTLCVGGTTRTLYIIEMLEKIIGKEVFQNADPELAICCGAAISSTKSFRDIPSNLNTDSDISNTSALLTEKRQALVNVLNAVLIKKQSLSKPANKAIVSPISEPLAKDTGTQTLPVNLKKRGNTTGNTINEGRVAYADGWIFFTDSLDSTMRKGRIRKIKTGELSVGIVTVTNNSLQRGNYLNIIDNWIYYSNDCSRLSRITINGTNYQCLDSDNICENMNIVDDLIYYSNSHNIFRCRLDGSMRTNLLKVTTNAIEDMNVSNGFIYYTYDIISRRIHKRSIDGTKKQVLNDDKSFHINVINEWIYYINADDNNTIYRIGTDGSKRTKFSNRTAVHLNVTEDWIYFIDRSSKYLYKMRIDGSNVIQLNWDTSNQINIADGWIYYVHICKEHFFKTSEYEIYRIRTDGSNRQLMYRNY
jgi:Ethanolamine utilization protein EutJ (predicted chaperonin)